jgi:phosphomannomutase
MSSAPLPLQASPIAFGTDGWRGILGVDITVERLLPVAAAAARELESSAPEGLSSREVVIGYDRRFLAPELAAAIAAAVRGANLTPVFSASPTPTPASSWAVVERGALGALVITASHNPPEWLGLKIKGPFGGSVEGDFTARVERRLAAGGISVPIAGDTEQFDAMGAYVAGLRAKVDTAGAAGDRRSDARFGGRGAAGPAGIHGGGYGRDPGDPLQPRPALWRPSARAPGPLSDRTDRRRAGQHRRGSTGDGHRLRWRWRPHRRR